MDNLDLIVFGRERHRFPGVQFRQESLRAIAHKPNRVGAEN
jgi:hypothetical protein